MLLEAKIVLGMISDTPVLDHEAMAQVLELTCRGRGRGLGEGEEERDTCYPRRDNNAA